MDFRILGPLDVRSGNGQVRRLVRRKQRLLLAGLLVNANQPVATERILDWLWGSSPPASAAQNLYSYVSDLRRQLQNDVLETPRIETRSGRYLLHVEQGELDAATFEELIGRAVRAADEGESALAAERFGRALRLWRSDVVLQVCQLLPGTPGCLTLITTRRQLTGLDDAHGVFLEELSPADAITLFTRAAGSGRVTPAERPAIAEVVEICGRLPLAIRLAAARLRHRPGWTVTELGDRLRRQRHRLAELEAGERSVAASFGLSYEQLDEGRQRTFRLLGLFPGADIDVSAVAALAGVPARRADRHLEDLLDANLLQPGRLDRYRFHDLIRAYAVQLCAEQEPEPEQAAALTRLFDHYVSTSSAAVATIYPYRVGRLPATDPPGPVPAFSGSREATAWLESQLGNLLAAAAEASSRDRPADAVRLASALYWHLRVRGYYSESEPLHARAVRHAHRAGDRRAETEALIALGHAHRGLGAYVSARQCFEGALAFARELGYGFGERDAMDALGNLHALGGRYEAAAGCFEHALAVARRIRDPGGELGALLGLGCAHHWRGLSDSAAGCYEGALAIAREIEDHGGVLRALLGLARIRLTQRAYDEATRLFGSALETAVACGDRPGELGALCGLGDVQFAVDQAGRALEYFEQVLKRALEIGDRSYQIEGLLGSGRAKQVLGRWKEALADHEEARRAAEGLDQPEDRARAHDGIARAQRALGRIDAARRHWERALEILEQLDLALPSELVDVEEARTFLAESAI